MYEQSGKATKPSWIRFTRQLRHITCVCTSKSTALTAGEKNQENQMQERK
jgi:hypothetical protein